MEYMALEGSQAMSGGKMWDLAVCRNSSASHEDKRGSLGT